MMYNNREAILDGTQLAADWTFSGLQKFGQGLLDKLRGLKLPHPLLEKVNIVYKVNGHRLMVLHNTSKQYYYQYRM